MFDDDAGRFIEVLDAFPGGIRIADIVVGKFLALQLSVAGQRSRLDISFTIEGGGLVRIFTIAHVLDLFELQVQDFRIGPAIPVALVRFQARHVVGDGSVILGGVRESFFGQFEPGIDGERTVVLFHFGNDAVVVGRIADNGHIPVILGGGTEHGRAADVDVFDGVVQCAVFPGDSLLEGVEVDDDHIDGIDTVFPDGIQMGAGYRVWPEFRHEFSDAGS